MEEGDLAMSGLEDEEALPESGLGEAANLAMSGLGVGLADLSLTGLRLEEEPTVVKLATSCGVSVSEGSSPDSI